MALTKTEQAFRAWASRLARVFGITPDDYTAIVRIQGGQCPICGKPVPDASSPGGNRRFPVDHDHKSGRIRGVPCEFCNRRRIGQWNTSNLHILRAVLDYLEDSPATEYFGEPRIVPGHGKRKRRRRPVS